MILCGNLGVWRIKTRDLDSELSDLDWVFYFDFNRIADRDSSSNIAPTFQLKLSIFVKKITS